MGGQDEIGRMREGKWKPGNHTFHPITCCNKREGWGETTQVYILSPAGLCSVWFLCLLYVCMGGRVCYVGL